MIRSSTDQYQAEKSNVNLIWPALRDEWPLLSSQRKCHILFTGETCDNNSEKSFLFCKHLTHVQWRFHNGQFCNSLILKKFGWWQKELFYLNSLVLWFKCRKILFESLNIFIRTFKRPWGLKGEHDVAEAWRALGNARSKSTDFLVV